MRVTGNKVSKRNILALLREQDRRCALTGDRLTPATASLDHLVALSKGGPNTIDNCQIVSVEVNAAKGTMSNEAFIAMCCKVADHCRNEVIKS